MTLIYYSASINAAFTFRVAFGSSVMDDTNSSDAAPYSEEKSEAAKGVEAFILCAIIFTAITGNVSIWIIILKTKPLRTITNMFILGLSAADLLVSIANMPLTVVSIFTGDWPLSDSACVLFGFINMLTLVTSVLSLCNISINRYFMVCRPSKFQDIYTKRNAIFMIIGVISLSIVLSSPPLFGWGEYAYIHVQSFCFCDWANHLSYAIFMILCCFGGPCSVMTVCNIFIYRAVRASRKKVSIRIQEASSVVSNKGTEDPKSDGKSNKDPEPLQRIPSDCNSEKHLIDNNQDITHTVVEVFQRDPTKAIDCNRPDNNNVKSGDKIKNNLLHPFRSIKKRKEKRVNALNNIVGEELDTSDVMSSETSNDQTDKRISNNSSSSSTLPRKQPPTKLRRKEEHRLAMSLIVVVIVFVMCWMPFCVSMLLLIFFKGSDNVPRSFHMFTLIIGYANSCCNPIIYGLMNKRFAAGFKDLYCFWKNRSFRMPVLSSP